MQEAVIAVSQDERVLWANQRMERLLPSGVRLGAPLVQSVRDPEILASVQNALDHSRCDHGSRRQDFFRPHLRCDRRSHAGRWRGRGAARSDRNRAGGKDAARFHRQRLARAAHAADLDSRLRRDLARQPTALPENRREFVEIIRKNATAHGPPDRRSAGAGARGIGRAQTSTSS